MKEQAAPTPRAAEPEPSIRTPDVDGLQPALITPAGVTPGLSGHAGRDRVLLRSVQRKAGNAAAVSLVRHAAAPRRNGSASAGPAPSVQRAVTVQRAPATIDGTSVATYADLDKWYADRVKRLQAQRDDLLSGGVASPPAIQSAISSGQSAAAVCRDDPTGALDGVRAIGAQLWLDNDYRKANNAAEAARGIVVANRVGTLTGAMRRAESSLRTEVLPGLRDKQRASYMKGNDEGLVATADAIATVVDTALVLKDGVTQASKTQKELASIVNVALMNQGHAPPLNANTWVTRIGQTIETANKAWAAIQLVRAGLDLAAGGKTASDQGTAAVKAMSTVISAGGTLLGASTGMTVYANLYIGPAVDACLKALEQLKDVARRINRDLMENGLYDDVNWDLEPGGRAMFDFMRAVMKADEASGVPDPIPPAVASYLGENADDLATGAKAEEMETSGFWFWKKADPNKAKYWIIRNKASLWGMFYGSLHVPS